MGFGCETKAEVVRILNIFQVRSKFSHIFKGSRQELFIDVAKHRPFLKKTTTKKTSYP